MTKYQFNDRDNFVKNEQYLTTHKHALPYVHDTNLNIIEQKNGGTRKNPL